MNTKQAIDKNLQIALSYFICKRFRSLSLMLNTVFSAAFVAIYDC